MRSSEASLSSSNNPHTAWNHCPVEKYIMAQLNANQMGGHLAAVVAASVQCARESRLLQASPIHLFSFVQRHHRWNQRCQIRTDPTKEQKPADLTSSLCVFCLFSLLRLLVAAHRRVTPRPQLSAKQDIS